MTTFADIKTTVHANLPFKKYSIKFLEGLKAKNASGETISGYGKDLEMVNRFLEEKYNGIVMLHDMHQ